MKCSLCTQTKVCTKADERKQQRLSEDTWQRGAIAQQRKRGAELDSRESEGKTKQNKTKQSWTLLYYSIHVYKYRVICSSKSLLHSKLAGVHFLNSNFTVRQPEHSFSTGWRSWNSVWGFWFIVLWSFSTVQKKENHLPTFPSLLKKMLKYPMT